jgi:hypothetical protein
MKDAPLGWLQGLEGFTEWYKEVQHDFEGIVLLEGPIEMSDNSNYSRMWSQVPLEAYTLAQD